MATSGRGTGIVGYMVQTVVDAKDHLTEAHEVTNVGHDRDQLATMARLAKTATGESDLIALVDRGDCEGQEILQCERAGVATIVPKPMTSHKLAEGLFDKRDFVDVAKDDQYRCPAGKVAIYRFTTEEAGKTLHKHWSTGCPQCPMKPRCTKGRNRRISRWEHPVPQPEAGDQDPGRRAADGSDDDLGRRPFIPNSTLCMTGAAVDTAAPETSYGAFSHSLTRQWSSFQTGHSLNGSASRWPLQPR